MGERWSAATTARILKNVKTERMRQGLSAQVLAERCTALGHPIPRGTFAKWDTNRRQSISIPELIIVASALEVPPFDLIYSPFDTADSVEALPGKTVNAADAELAFLEPPVDGSESKANTIRKLINGYLRDIRLLERVLTKPDEFQFAPGHIKALSYQIHSQWQSILDLEATPPAMPSLINETVAEAIENFETNYGRFTDEAES